MAYMTRGQLLFKDYDWHAKEEADNPNVRGFPDSSRLARKEGYEVLAFINHLAKVDKWVLSNEPHDANNLRIPETGHKVERMLRIMPGNIQGRTKVHDWLKDNWLRH